MTGQYMLQEEEGTQGGMLRWRKVHTGEIHLMHNWQSSGHMLPGLHGTVEGNHMPNIKPYKHVLGLCLMWSDRTRPGAL